MSRNVAEDTAARREARPKFASLYPWMLLLMVAMVAGLSLSLDQRHADATGETVTIGPPGTPGTLLLTGQTYDGAKAALAVGDTFIIPLDIPGMAVLDPISVEAVSHDLTNTLTLSAPAPVAAFPTGSPLAGVQLDLMVVAEWTDANTDSVPTIVVAVRLTDIDLEDIVPAWGPIPGVADAGQLTEAIVLLTETPGMTLEPASLPDAAKAFLGVDGDLVDPLPLDSRVSLLAELNLAQNAAFAAAADLFGHNAGEALILAGDLAQTADFLFGAAAGFDEDGFSLDSPIVIDSGLLPAWLQNQVPEFQLRIAGGVASGRIRGSGDVVAGGVTNTVNYDATLSEAQDLTVEVSLPTFNVPFGLDGLGWGASFTDVALGLSRTGGNFSGSFHATAPIGGTATDIRIALDNTDSSTMTVVSIEGPVPVPHLASLLSGTTFSGADYSQLGFATATLDNVEFSFFHDDGASETVLGLYGAVSGLEVLGADDLQVRLLVGVDKDPAGTTVLVALRVDDESCPGNCIDIHQVLNIPNLSLTADIKVPAMNFVVVAPEGGPGFSTNRLGPDAKAFLDAVNGSPAPTPYIVTGALNLMAEVPLGGISDLLSPLGISPAGTSIHVQGSAGITLPFFDGQPGSGSLDNFSVEAVLDGVDTSHPPEGFPNWLTLPGTGAWKLFLRFAEGGPGDGDDTLEIGASLAGVEVSPGLMTVPPITLSAVFAGQVSGGSPDWTIVASAVLDDEWVHPFGIGFLTVTNASAVLTIDQPADQPVAAKAEVCGTFDVAGVVTTVCFLITNAAGGQATFRISLDEPVSLQDIATLLGMGITLPDAVGSASLNGELDFTVTGPGVFSINAVVSASFRPFDEAIGIDLMLSASFGGPSSAVAVGVQPHPGITLGDFLPPIVALPFDLELTSGAPNTGFALLFTTGVIDPDADGLPPSVKDFFLPLFGGDATDKSIPEGLSVLGAFALPEPLAGLVSGIGLDPNVLVGGSLPLPMPGDSEPNLGLALSLTLRLRGGLVPEPIEKVEFTMGIAINPTPSPAVEFSLGGNLFIRMKQGIDGDLADTLEGLGLTQVPVATAVVAGASCPRGGFNMVEDADASPAVRYCYDRLLINATATLVFTAGPPPSVTLLLKGMLTSLNVENDPNGGWSPLGFEDLQIQQIGASIEFGFVAPSNLAVKVGVIGNVTLFDKTVSVAAKVGALITVVPPPVFVSPVVPLFEGFRIAAPDGVESEEFVDLLQLLVDSVGGPELALDPGLPNFAVKNLFLSISPLGVQGLCIEQGLKIRGDLYIDPPADMEVMQTPVCNPANGAVPIPAGDLCVDRKDEGCVAGINIDISFAGIIAEASLAGFTIEPLQMRFDDAVLALRLTLADQYIRIRGGMEIGEMGNPHTIGRMALEIKPLSAEFAGQVRAFGFNALVSGSTNVNPLVLFTGSEDFGLKLHVVLASDSSTFQGYGSVYPDFSEKVRADVERTIDDLAEVVEFIEDTVDDFNDDPLGTVLDLPSRLQDEGYDGGILPDWVSLIAGKNDDAEDDLDGADATFSLEDLVNGFTFDGVEIGYTRCAGVIHDGICYGVSYDPPACFGFEEDGHCYLVTPQRFLTFCTVANFGSIASDGYCSDEEFEDAIEDALPGIFQQFEEFSGLPDSAAVFGIVEDWLANPDTAFGLQCASLDVELALLGQSSIDIDLLATLLGQDFGFAFFWDFGDPAGSAARLLAELIGGSSNPDCTGVDDAVFGAGGLGSPEGLGLNDEEEELPPLTVSIVRSPASVLEGSQVTGKVTFQRAVDDSDGPQTVVVDWGDGTTNSLSIGAGSQFANFTHTYVDDDPSGTTTDVYTITATAAETADTATVTVKNVPPADLSLGLSASTINEGEEIQLTVAWTDVGLADSFVVRVDWGDGVIQHLAASSPATFSHRYRDDSPSATASDAMLIRVRVSDDDRGQISGSSSLTVNNVPPVESGIAFSITQADEGAETTFTLSWDDVGILDTHLVAVDWDGDGSFDEQRLSLPSDPPAVTRTMSFTHVFVDDHPSTGTPQDNVAVRVVIRDDDTGEASSTENILVHNIAPRLCLVVDPDAADPAKGDDCPQVALSIDEETRTMTVRGVYQDPGVLDTHEVVIDWGVDLVGSDDPDFPDTVFRFEPEEGAPAGDQVDGHAFSATRTYGDNGTFVITVTVTDDDTGSDVSTATITVGNVDPLVALDETDTILGDGPDEDGVLDEPTFVVRKGESLSLAATATDPGSDDLEFTWDWDAEDRFGDLQDVQESMVNPPSPDPLPSPSVQPRSVPTTASHSWAQACLYNVGLTVLDDDGGTGADDTWVVVTGTDSRIRAPGYWYNQYDDSKQNSNSLSAATLGCYLEIVRHMSRVFNSSLVEVYTSVHARDVLNTKQTSDPKQIMVRQLLAAWRSGSSR